MPDVRRRLLPGLRPVVAGLPGLPVAAISEALATTNRTVLTLPADLSYCCEELFKVERPTRTGQPLVRCAIWPVREDPGHRVYEREWDGWHRDGRLCGMGTGG